MDAALQEVSLQFDVGADLPLPADCVIPPQASGVVLFIHGSGSNRFSQRNRAVAVSLQQAGLATMLIDWLTSTEQLNVASQRDPHSRDGLDLMRLSARVIAVIDALELLEPLGQLPLGLYGSSSGAALALAAAAARRQCIAAVVSRGGRPDLVLAVLGDVCCPTLLLVGSHDLDVLELNTWAAAQLRGLHELRVVPGAGHLFAESGALELVSDWSKDWFLQHLRPTDAAKDLQG